MKYLLLTLLFVTGCACLPKLPKCGPNEKYKCPEKTMFEEHDAAHGGGGAGGSAE